MTAEREEVVLDTHAIDADTDIQSPRASLDGRARCDVAGAELERGKVGPGRRRGRSFRSECAVRIERDECDGTM